VEERDRDDAGHARNARPRDRFGRPLPPGTPGIERVPDNLDLPPDETLDYEQRLLDDGAWVTLYHYASRALIRPGVKGLERSPLSTAPEFLAPLRKVHLE